MNRGFATAAIVVTLVAATVGCARLGIGKMKAEEAIPARQQLMKEQGAALRSISDKLKAGNVQAIEVDAKKLEDTSKQIPKLFPEGSVDPKVSRAKPEIWQKWAEFEGNAKNLNTKSKTLQDIAKSGNAQQANAAVADIGRTTCTQCHNSFRGPEIKK